MLKLICNHQPSHTHTHTHVMWEIWSGELSLLSERGDTGAAKAGFVDYKKDWKMKWSLWRVGLQSGVKSLWGDKPKYIIMI